MEQTLDSLTDLLTDDGERKALPRFRAAPEGKGVAMPKCRAVL